MTNAPLTKKIILKIRETLKPKKKEEKEEPNFLEFYCNLLYKNIGRQILRNKKFKQLFYKNFYNKRYESILKKANLKMIPEEYFVSIFLTIIFILGTGTTTSLIFLFIDRFYSAAFFYGSIFVTSLICIALYNYPIVLMKNRADEIDAAIPYLLPYLKILSKELTLSKIVQIIDDFLIYKEIKIEFQKIKYYSEILGYDLYSSIRIVMENCPSKKLSDLMNDLVTISNSGGDIYHYLERKLEHLEDELNVLEKKNLDTLLIYSQIYIVILLISPLFYMIMNSILSMINLNGMIGGASNSPGANQYFSTFLLLMILPFAYAFFMMLVYYSKPLYTRLKPIKNEIYIKN